MRTFRQLVVEFLSMILGFCVLGAVYASILLLTVGAALWVYSIIGIWGLLGACLGCLICAVLTGTDLH